MPVPRRARARLPVMVKKMTTIAAASTVAVVLFAPTASASTSGAAPARADRVVRSVGTVAPDRAWHTLSLIDAGQWPPGDGSGTRGGAVWPNRESRLPSAHYRQWDVNRKQPGRPRDGERIVTGDDGSAWYTPDLFHTFTRMR
ncbi:ribonuclease domain-containing protein [Streptomyces roseoverticillatus]|uniref:Ribonuclease domain-containing protein n=1 Tax=Streptomyces roseoverticillatus TaxID=66429 RepID=A0ABV3ISR0_9ACTN